MGTIFFLVVITRVEDIMADNNPSPRAKPEDECYYRHPIRDNGLKLFYFLPTDSIANSVQQKILT